MQILWNIILNRIETPNPKKFSFKDGEFKKPKEEDQKELFISYSENIVNVYEQFKIREMKFVDGTTDNNNYGVNEAVKPSLKLFKIGEIQSEEKYN